jgi:hypothetical protein
MVTIVKPIAQVTHADWKFAVLDKQSAGSCFAVTAYHGNSESARSVQYCIASNGVAKTLSLDPDRIGTMIADAFVWADKTPTDNEYANRNLFIRDLLSVMVGHSHTASLFRDQAHTQVSQYTNSIYRGYAHFNASQLFGHQIAQAQLSLPGGSTTNGLLCIVHYGAADHMWNPGDRLVLATQMGGGPYQGPDLNLDVTALVQSWANGSAQNNGIAMEDDQPLASGNMVMINDSCTSNFPTIKLNVTYY